MSGKNKQENLCQCVLDKIKSEKIAPKPRWRFLLKDYSILVLIMVSLVIGGVAVAVVIYMVKTNDWDLYSEISGSMLGFAIASMPYLWLIFLSLFIFAADYNFKHTKKGYKYGIEIISVASICTSVLLGIFFYNFGIGQVIDEIFSKNVPVYSKLFDPRAKMWSNPEKGLLVGVVIEVKNKERFMIEDFGRKKWNIIVIENTKFRQMPTEFIQNGEKLKMLGRTISKNEFEAQFILPFRLRRDMMMEMHDDLMKRHVPEMMSF